MNKNKEGNPLGSESDSSKSDEITSITPEKKSVVLETVKGILIGAIAPAVVAAGEALILRKSHPTFSQRFSNYASQRAIFGSLQKDSLASGLLLGVASAAIAHSYNEGLEVAGELSEGRKQALTLAEKIIAQKNEQPKEAGVAVPQNSR